MCTGIELAMAVSAGSSLLGGMGQQAAGEEQKALNEIDARAEIAAAQNTVKQIKRQKEAVQGAARAAYAASGVTVDTGTAALVNNDIATRAGEDIYQTLVEGNQRAQRLRVQGQQAADNGKDALGASILNGGATVLGGLAKSKGWS